MKILILYDSKFGNTKKVVETVKETLTQEGHSVTLLLASDMKEDPVTSSKVDALIVASPTHNESASDPIKKALSKFSSPKWSGVPAIAISTDYRQVIDANAPSAVHYIQKELAKRGMNLIDLLFRIPVEAMKGPIDKKAIQDAAKEINELIKQL